MCAACLLADADAFGDYSARSPGAMQRANEARNGLRFLSTGVLTLTPRDNRALANSAATVADENADLHYEASNFRDPHIATPQDKVHNKLAGEQIRHTCSSAA